MVMKRLFTVAALACMGSAAMAQDQAMSFFVTSANPGQGAGLGGLEGADAHCAELAAAAGAEGDWKAYLSTDQENARDRIGSGPWYNADGVEIAADIEALHGDGNAISKETALDEMGNVVNGRGDEPNRHDILTGTMPDGTAAAETCENWTNSGEGSAMVGHHDRMGLDDSDAAKSWNSSHPSRGCSLEALQGTGGDGLFYCFAAN
ncbi:MAG: hypothetical protein ACU0B9_16055 [Limimaricola soesokkakensis]|uniref:hypothetical protein n=1 Tax=Limimaricola soesokkakensis TaxID=1343159 RepID=UPI0040591417